MSTQNSGPPLSPNLENLINEMRSLLGLPPIVFTNTINPAGTFVSNVTGAGTTISNATADIFQPIITAIDTALSDLWNGFASAISDVFGNIIDGINGLWTDLHNAFVGLVTWLTGIWDGLTKFVGSVFGDIINAAAGAINYLASLFFKLYDFFDGLWNNFTSMIRTAIADIVNWVTGALNWIVTAVHNFALGAVNAVTGFMFDYVINPIISFMEHTLATFISRMDMLVAYWLIVPQIFNAPKAYAADIDKYGMTKGIGISTGKLVAGGLVSYIAGRVSQAFIQSLGNPSPQLPRANKATLNVTPANPVTTQTPISNPSAVATIGTSVTASLNRLQRVFAGISTSVTTKIGSKPQAGIGASMATSVIGVIGQTPSVGLPASTIGTSVGTSLTSPLGPSSGNKIVANLGTSVLAEITTILAPPIPISIGTRIGVVLSSGIPVSGSFKVSAAIGTAVSMALHPAITASVVAKFGTSLSTSISTTTIPTPTTQHETSKFSTSFHHSNGRASNCTSNFFHIYSYCYQCFRFINNTISKSYRTKQFPRI